VDKLEQLLSPHPRVSTPRPGMPNPEGRCVLYWMQRAQRGIDNPALNFAIALGNVLKLPVLGVFGLTTNYPGAQRRHYRFLVQGLVDAEHDLKTRGVPFIVRLGEPDRVVMELATELSPAAVVGDENPIRVGKLWRRRLAEQLRVPLYLIDADVVVPTSLFPKEEFAARTLRPKIHRVLQEYLVPLPTPKARLTWDEPLPSGAKNEPDSLMAALEIGGASEIPAYVGGTREALRRLALFVRERLPRYDTERNEPTPYMTSELSAHLHFGHVSPLTIALEVLGSEAPRESIDVYIEELIVRRELAINFVAQNPDYDRLAGCPEWGRKTLAAHADDRRPVIYTARQLEEADTHDRLWNACQKEMVLSGRMHNYMRMYWAKKILEWSPDAETAFDIAVDLNDRYEMDGRDPNGYTGVAWAIGGKHDRPWPERPIFGTIRFMSYDGARRKLDAEAYVARVAALERAPGGVE
jgi:deoxyribodipyrimidine photo-lyase